MWLIIPDTVGRFASSRLSQDFLWCYCKNGYRPFWLKANTFNSDWALFGIIPNLPISFFILSQNFQMSNVTTGHYDWNWYFFTHIDVLFKILSWIIWNKNMLRIHYRQTYNITHTKSKLKVVIVSSCTRICPVHWSQVLSLEWRCRWSSADNACQISERLEEP